MTESRPRVSTARMSLYFVYMHNNKQTDKTPHGRFRWAGTLVGHFSLRLPDHIEKTMQRSKAVMRFFLAALTIMT